MLYRYFLIAVACAAILLGIQVPNFVDQYQKRLDAHLIEVTENLRGFQQIANKYHHGSLDALIREHEESASPAFRGEAVPIKAMYERYRMFSTEQSHMNTHLMGKVAHVAFGGNRRLMAETRTSYSFNIPLDQDAVIAGLLFAGAALVLTELLVQVIVSISGWLLRSGARARQAG